MRFATVLLALLNKLFATFASLRDAHGCASAAMAGAKERPFALKSFYHSSA
jgi:hypothetical protein